MADIITGTTEKIKADISWIQKHERFLLVTLFLLITLFLGNKFLDDRASKAEARAIIAEQIVQQDKTYISQLQAQSEQNAKVSAQAIAQYQQTVDALTRQNQSLSAAITARNQQLAEQQAHIATAPLPEVVERVKTLAGVDAADIGISGSNTTVTDKGTRQIASKLEQIPVLEGNLTDTQKIADNRQKEIDSGNRVISTQTAQIVGLNTQISGLNTLVTDGEKACKAKVDSVNASQRKSKRNWFVGGVLTGAAIVGRIALWL